MSIRSSVRVQKEVSRVRVESYGFDPAHLQQYITPQRKPLTEAASTFHVTLQIEAHGDRRPSSQKASSYRELASCQQSHSRGLLPGLLTVRLSRCVRLGRWFRLGWRLWRRSH